MLEQDELPELRCKVCGKLIQRTRGHRPREYCNAACRQAQHRRKQREAERKARRELEQIPTSEEELELRIDELEDKVHELQARLAFEERYRTDTTVRHFKVWLKQHPQPKDTDFAKRFLSDTRLPQHASRSLYEARMRVSGYSEEDLVLFRDAWLQLLLEEEA